MISSSQVIKYNMHIDSPIIRRKNIYDYQAITPNHLISPQRDIFPFGQERRLIAAYVNDTLNAHKDDQQIIQKFRREAQQRKKAAFLLKISPSPQSLPAIQQQSPTSSHQYTSYRNMSAINPSKLSIQSIPQQDLQSPQSYEIERFKSMLREKDKQLHRKDKKIGRIKRDLQKMSQKIKCLEMDKELLRREEESELNTAMDLIQSINSRIAENKQMMASQINQIKYCFNQPSHTPITQEQPTPKRNYKKSLEKIKQTALQIRQQSSRERNKSNPVILYHSQPNHNYLDDLNRSIIRQQKKQSQSKLYFQQNQQP